MPKEPFQPTIPKDWPQIVPEKIGPSFSRERVIRLLNAVLGPQPEPKPEEPLRKLFWEDPDKFHGPRVTHLGKDNSAQEMAVQNMIKMFPEAASRVDSVYTGANFPHSTIGGYYTNPEFNTDGSRIVIGDNDYTKEVAKTRTYKKSASTMAHELSHPMGMPDYTHPNAYEIGKLMDLYNEGYQKDIHLSNPDKSSGYKQDINLPNPIPMKQPPNPIKTKGLGPAPKSR